METPVINRVATSSLITLDLQDYLPTNKIITLDLAPFLFQGLLLREKDFRESIKNLDTHPYQDSYVGIYCSTDAIIPTWAYMLATLRLLPFAKQIVEGNILDVKRHLITQAINTINPADYLDAKVVVKGCSDDEMPIEAYVAITRKLGPVVSSLMFGEACSAVPLYKKVKPAPLLQ